MADARALLAELKAPFPVESIRWLCGEIVQDEDGRWTRPIACVDANALREHLDSVVPLDWDNRFVGTTHGLCCEISIEVDGRRVTRANGIAGFNYDDAFVAAARMFGIGILTIESDWVEVDERGQIKESEMLKLKSFLQHLMGARKPAKAVEADSQFPPRPVVEPETYPDDDEPYDAETGEVLNGHVHEIDGEDSDQRRRQLMRLMRELPHPTADSYLYSREAYVERRKAHWPHMTEDHKGKVRDIELTFASKQQEAMT